MYIIIFVIKCSPKYVPYNIKYNNEPINFLFTTNTIQRSVKNAIITSILKEEKNDIPKNDDIKLDLVMKVFNETLGSKISPVEHIPEPVEQVETKKEENLKPKKKRTLK